MVKKTKIFNPTAATLVIGLIATCLFITILNSQGYSDPNYQYYLAGEDGDNFDISQPGPSVISQQIEVDKLINKANTYKEEKSLSLALEEFQQAYDLETQIQDNSTINTIQDNIEYIRSQIQPPIKTTPYSLRIPILMYHYIRINPIPTDIIGYGLSVTPRDFEEQMNYLATHGYTTITIDQLVNALKYQTPIPKKSVILTFDDGYQDFYTNAFPILQKYKFQAESYVITGFVGKPNYMNWNMLREVLKSGLITIGSHTIHHLDLTTVSQTQLANELNTSKQTLEKELGVNILDFCYPSGMYNTNVEKAVINAGYEDATTTAFSPDHSNTNYYDMPRIRIPGGISLSGFIKNLNSY